MASCSDVPLNLRHSAAPLKQRATSQAHRLCGKRRGRSGSVNASRAYVYSGGAWARPLSFLWGPGTHSDEFGFLLWETGEISKDG